MCDLLSVQVELNMLDADNEELHRLALGLRGELTEDLAIDVELARRANLVKGAKGEPITAGVLMLAVLPVLLPKLVELLQHWTVRSSGRSIRVKFTNSDRTIEVDVTGTNDSLQQLQQAVKQQLSQML